MTKFKYGDKIKISFKKWIDRENEVEFGEYGNTESVPYESSIEIDDQILINHLLKNTIFTIDMIDKGTLPGFYNKIGTIITLKELTEMNIHMTFNEDELIKE